MPRQPLSRRCARAQADKVRVKDYIHRLDNFDGPAVGEIAVGYEMFEEAFEIYKKFSLKSQAIKVLLDHLDDLPRALEYAIKVRCGRRGRPALHALARQSLLEPAVWTWPAVRSMPGRQPPEAQSTL